MPTDKGDGLSKVVKLNGLNYHEWKDDIKMILTMTEYWRILNSGRPPRDADEDGLGN